MIDRAAFAKRVESIQWTVLCINVAVIISGGSNFGLAVASRPILRLTSTAHTPQVRSICDLNIATGIMQILVGGYDIFAANWKLLRPLYLGIAVALVTMLVEIVSICTLSYLYTESHLISTENIVQPWFLMECEHHGSCEQSMAFYTRTFMMPQVGLSALCIVLQGFTILFLFKLVRTLNEKQFQIYRAKEMIRQEQGNSKVRLTGAMETAKESKEKNDDQTEPTDGSIFGDSSDGDNSDSSPPHSPSSILLEEHGYVPAAGSALDADYDDASVIRNRGKNQALSFSTSVEIHILDRDQKGGAEGPSRTSTTQL